MLARGLLSRLCGSHSNVSFLLRLLHTLFQFLSIKQDSINPLPNIRQTFEILLSNLTYFPGQLGAERTRELKVSLASADVRHVASASAEVHYPTAKLAAGVGEAQDDAVRTEILRSL